MSEECGYESQCRELNYTDPESGSQSLHPVTNQVLMFFLLFSNVSSSLPFIALALGVYDAAEATSLV